jgi:hypothetical protein
LTCQAAVELLIGHRWWLVRDDFLSYVELCRGFHGEAMAAIDWRAVWAAVEDGHLPCSRGEGQVLRVVASIAEASRSIFVTLRRVWTRSTAFWWLARC